MTVFEMLGFAGTIIVAVAYIPQIAHIIFERCSYGISVKAWLLWTLSAILIFVHAFYIQDMVFITLQTINIVAIVMIIMLSIRYSGKACRMHKP